MTRAKTRRKQPLFTTKAAVAVSHRVTQTTISTFHVLLKRQARLSKLQSFPESRNAKQAEELAAVINEIDELGGLDRYQDASKLGQSTERGGDTSRVLISWLRELKYDRTWSRKLRLLEIGALSPANYAGCSTWIENHPIDLHSRHPDIVEQDILDRPVPHKMDELFDIISCSLVLNYVPEPRDRGRMLALAHSQLKPLPTSLLFLVLPAPCLNNSRYVTTHSLKELMRGIGFKMLREQCRLGGKLTYTLWGWGEPASDFDFIPWERKVVEVEGSKRNNFVILM